MIRLVDTPSSVMKEKLTPASLSGYLPELEYYALHFLAAHDEPIGCTRLRLALKDAGFPVSESKSGRLLRHLDESGYAQTVGTKGGRMLLPAGVMRLKELERIRAVRERYNEILRIVPPKDLASLRDLLIARRALERETARLAASRDISRELDGLESFIERHNAALTRGDAAELQLGIEIHREIARLAGNRIIASLLDLLLHQVALWDLEAAILRSRRATSPQDHYRLLEALRRNDPDAAEAAILAHIDRILNEIVDYAAAQRAFHLDSNSS